MASHQLAIAKAAFSAGLLRPDPTSVSREEIARFHSSLNSVVLQCTPKNVQQCKQWILANIVQSTARFTALGKYLTTLCALFPQATEQKDKSTKGEPSTKRKRLHVLYLLNDILYHSKYRISDASICGKIQPTLVSLISSAASFKECPKHQRKISDLLDLWQEKEYYSKEYIEKLRETAKNATEEGQHNGLGVAENGAGLPTKSTKSAPYVMPAMHGEVLTPWFDLPAGNLMPHIIPNSTRPINPDLIKPLQFVAGPADERLASAVRELLEDVNVIFGTEDQQDESLARDIDELGQQIILDEITGEIIDGEGYYGWSKSFCEKMKRRKKGPEPSTHDEARLSRSRSSSPEPRKRRYSDDSTSSREGLRSTRRRRSYSSSRSPSPGPRRHNGQSRSRSRDRSDSRSPKPAFNAPEQISQMSRSFPPQVDNLPPRPPMPPFPVPPPHQGFNPNFPPPPPPPPPMQNMPYTQQPQFQPPFPQAQQFNQWSVPPPPPPPQQHMQNMPFNPQQGQPYGQWPPPPPPPGPPPNNYQQQFPQQGQQYNQYQTAGPGGWQQGSGRGFSGGNGGNGGWNNAPRGRGGYRGGRGW